MDRALSLLICITLAFTAVVSAPLLYRWCEVRMYEQSRETGVRFQLSITSERPLRNATLFVPLPVKNGLTLPGMERYGGESFVGSSQFVLLDLFAHRDALFLKLAIDDAEDESGRQEGSGLNRYTLDSVEYLEDALDVEEPESNSFVFRPRDTVREVGCESEGGSKEPRRCSTYESRIYMTRDRSAGDITVEVAITVENRWDTLSNRRNEYRDRIRVEATENTNGWLRAEGFMAAGIGDPNPFYSGDIGGESLNLTPITSRLRDLMFTSNAFIRPGT